MKANQLRIGNLAKDKLTNDFLICSGLECDNDGSNSKIIFSVVNREKYPLPNGWKAEPIPITEDWLLRLNAKKEKNGVFCYGRFRLRFLEAYNYWYVTEKTDKTYISKVEFVHEWQNLIFVLDGEELTLKNEL